MQRKPLKKTTSFKDNVDVFYYDDPNSIATTAAAAANKSTLSLAIPNDTQFQNQPAKSTKFDVNHSEDTAKNCEQFDCIPDPSHFNDRCLTFADDDDSSNDVDSNSNSTKTTACAAESRLELTQSGSTIQFESGSSPREDRPVAKVQTYGKQNNNNSTITNNNNSDNSVRIQSNSRCKRYTLQSVNNDQEEGSPKDPAPLVGTITVTSASNDVGNDVLRAVIHLTDRPTRDVKTVVRAMSDGRAIVVTTYETDVLNSTPPRVEKISLPVQVNPFAMKALVQRQGPLVIEAPVVCSSTQR